jgi:hypothetical protein
VSCDPNLVNLAAHLDNSCDECANGAADTDGEEEGETQGTKVGHGEGETLRRDDVLEICGQCAPERALTVHGAMQDGEAHHEEDRAERECERKLARLDSD